MIYPDVKKLYKYRSIASKTPDDNDGNGFNRYTTDMIADNTAWFSDPNDFADPFDCCLEFLLRNVDLGAVDEGEKKLWSLLEDHSVWDANSKIKYSGILSLSESRNNILMWSHYGDNHRGICIEYERIDTNLLGQDQYTKPVRYTDLYPKFCLEETRGITGIDFSINDPTFQSLIYTKSFQWSYEREWRAIQSANPTRAIKLDGAAITSIIFGLNTPQEHKDYIKSIVLKNGKNDIKFMKMIRHDGEFALLVIDE